MRSGSVDLNYVSTWSEGVVRRDRPLIDMIDFLLSDKTHKGRCRVAATL